MVCLARVLLLIVISLSCAGLLTAQTSANQSSAITVTVTAGAQHVRYVSIGEVQQTRVQVFAPNGSLTFDSQFKMGNLVDWALQDERGSGIPGGAYLFVVTVKDFAGRLSQRFGTATFDEDRVYVERASLGDLQPAQSAALENNRQGESLTPVERIGAMGLSAPANSSRNLVADKAVKAGSAQSDPAAAITPSVGGAGATGQLTKWVDGANGNLGDSIITESSNNIGINTTSPSFLVDARSSAPNATIAISSVLGVPPDNVGFLTGVDTANRGRYDFMWRGGTGGLSLRNGSNTAGNILFFTNSSGSNGLGNETEKVRIDRDGNVGIGATNPAFKLDVRNGLLGVTDANAKPAASLRSLGVGGRGALEMYDNSTLKTALYSDANDSFINGGGKFGIGTKSPYFNLDVREGVIGVTDASSRPVVTMRGIASSRGAVEMYNGGVLRTALYSDGNNSFISGGGNFGVGTNQPQSKLDVVGDVNVSGNGNFAGNLAAKYQDVAEWVLAREQFSPGTVVTIDPTQPNIVRTSSKSYDPLVAGVISAKPGLVLGEAGKGKVMVATTGRVLVKVDARRAPIRIGDLLVTSGTPGVAMRSAPIRFGRRGVHRPGTIIGKALEPLARGQREILVLLTLQ